MVYWEVKFTTFDNNGKSRLTETVRMDDGYKAIQTAYNIIEMEHWVNVQVIEHGRYKSPSIEFDWRFYNQPEWCRYILGMDQDDEEEE